MKLSILGGDDLLERYKATHMCLSQSRLNRNQEFCYPKTIKLLNTFALNLNQ